MLGWNRITVLALVVVLPACVRWKPVAIPVAPAPPNVVADRSRIRLTTGQRVEFLTLVVATDSIFGIRNNLARTRLTVSFDQVSRIEVRQKDPVRTMAVIGAIGLVMFYTGALGFGPR
jgi:hypothetical protein